MLEFRQNIQTFNEPSQKFAALIEAQKIRHDGNPVLRSHVDRVTIKTDVNENIRPVKDQETGRIDGTVATIQALARAMVPTNTASVYETQEMMVMD